MRSQDSSRRSHVSPFARFPRAARSLGGGLLLLVTALFLAGCASGPRGIASSREVRRLFANPPREYATAPLWVWNDLLTEAQVRETLRDLAREEVRQVFVHPRPGLMTPYLGEEWFRLWRAALDEAGRLDMNVWIYDENSYPSGFAGGFVPEAMPESRGRGLTLEETEDPVWGEAHIGLYRMTQAGFEDVTARARRGEELPAGRSGSDGPYVGARVVRAQDSPWHGGRSYVDLLYPGVTERFLDITLGAYEREVGGEFGRRIPGIFTDEPEILPAGGLPWTDDLPGAFEARWGYSLLAHLPSLTRPLGDWRRVRHNYFQTLLDLFIERWAKPYYERCERAGLEFTGHYWEHEWPRCLLVPDNMAMSAWQQRPGIDTLMNRYEEGVHSQFGNVRAVREISSLANQLGRTRTLCEAYGAGGWDLRFEDMKRIGDWLLALGVNTIDEHLSYITIRGARKKDHPQSFSYHEPWWPAYHVRASYVARLQAALSQGEQVNPFLVIEPTTTAWLYQADPSHSARLEEIGSRFQELLLELERAQVEYDIGCEDVIAREGALDGSLLRVGKRSYRAVVLPPLAENLNGATAFFLEAMARSGGTVIACGDPPSLVDGTPSDRFRSAASVPGWQRVAAEDVPGLLSAMAPAGFWIQRHEADSGFLLHHRRKLADGELLFLANTAMDAPSRGTIRSTAAGVERWDPYTGEVLPLPFARSPSGIAVSFEIPPAGSLLLFFSEESREPALETPTVTTTIEPAGPPEVARLDPNVLVLDYVDVSAGGETREGTHVYQAGLFAFQKNGMERNPWDSAVQFGDEFISREFPAESGFTATYRFTVEESVPESIYAVVEREDLYRVTLNGKPLPPPREDMVPPGSWWLDRSFGVLDLHGAVEIGENLLVLEARPFTLSCEIEAVYILGRFGVKPAERGFAIVPERLLDLGPWKDQLHAMYGGPVRYREAFEIPSPAGRYRVRVPRWYGSVAHVLVNGDPASHCHIEAAPWAADVTPWIRPGTNIVEVTVVGTLKNTLGPHHAGAGLGSAWPAMFHEAPSPGPPAGTSYATVGYGLFAPFTMEQEITERESESRDMEMSDGDERGAEGTRRSQDGSTPDAEKEARLLVGEHEAKVRPLEVDLQLAWWKANTSGRDEDYREKEAAQNRLDAALADPARFARLRGVRAALAKAPPHEARLARQIDLLYLQALEKQVDPELLRRMSEVSNRVEKAFNVFRAEVDGKALTDSEVRKALKESTDSAFRRKVWEASKTVGQVVDSDLRELVKLRNEAARKLGFKDYHVLALELTELSQERVLGLFDELEELTRGPFRALKGEIDAKLAAAYGVPASDLRPWHYQDPFFQEAPAIYDADLDAAYAAVDVAELCRRFYAGIGLPVDDVLSRSDLYERSGKSPHAFCTDIDREGDVRVLANIVPNEYWAGTVLHELGHAVYSSKNMSPSLPYVLRSEAHILATEGMAMLFEKFSKSASWLRELGVAVKDPQAFEETGRALHRAHLLIFTAWCQVMLRFEAAMYADPDQDLNALWWDLVERYQEVRRPEGRNAPDHASKIHIVSAPAYYHNYLLGQLFAAQLHEAIARDVLGAEPEGAIYNGRREIGEYLRTRVFASGRSLDWNGLTRSATGEELSPRAFARSIGSSENR